MNGKAELMKKRLLAKITFYSSTNYRRAVIEIETAKMFNSRQWFSA